ncbi:MAG: hypothetical protein ACP5NQ_00195 [Vulcanisaeta sp.]
MRASYPIIKPRIAVAMAYIDKANNVPDAQIKANHVGAQNAPIIVASFTKK